VKFDAPRWLTGFGLVLGLLPVDDAALALVDLGAIICERIVWIRQAVEEICLGQHRVGKVIIGIEVEFDIKLHHGFVVQPRTDVA